MFILFWFCNYPCSARNKFNPTVSENQQILFCCEQKKSINVMKSCKVHNNGNAWVTK